MLNIIIVGPYLFEGMAGTRRVYNNLYTLFQKGKITLNNLVIPDVDAKTNDEIPTEFLSLNSKNYLNYFSSYYRGFRFIKRFSGKTTNIFFIYGYPYLLILPLIFFAKRSGFKIVYDIVEDIDAIIDPKNILSRLNIWVTKKNLARWLKKADGIIPITDYLENKILKIVDSATPICKLPISVDVNNFEPPNWHQNNQRLKIFYGGSFGFKDGLDTLLEAIRILVFQFKFSGFELVLTGKGSERHMNSFWNLVNKYNVSEFIDFRGYVTYNEYIKIIQSSDLLCITRNTSKFASAGFPFKLGEFLASGKPVLVTRIGEIENYLTSDSAMLLEPENPQELAEKILLLTNDKSLCESIGKRGRAVAEKYFSAQKVAEKLNIFFNSL